MPNAAHRPRGIAPQPLDLPPRSTRHALLLGVTITLIAACGAAQEPPIVSGKPTDHADFGLTSVDGIQVGQVTLDGRPTGCTVVLADGGATGAVDVRGGAPATRETDLLRPENLVDLVHAVVLSGGSAYGLDSASGVMRWLEERGVGFPVRGTVVPIVVGASLLDLGIGPAGADGSEVSTSLRPDADCGYRAANAASTGPVEEGNVGAGAGATLGKVRGLELAMKGGLGTASHELQNGLQVGALVAVNAVGDVIDPATGRVVAGVRTADGKSLADARLLLREQTPVAAEAIANTTLAVVATNARLTKTQATKVAQMAQDGFARALYPAHSPFDGDAVFVLATGRWSGEVNLQHLGTLAADAVADAIVRAARQAKSLPGLPAARDLQTGGESP